MLGLGFRVNSYKQVDGEFGLAVGVRSRGEGMMPSDEYEVAYDSNRAE